MKCPACDNNLTEINATGIKINVCKGSCGGLWVKNTQIKKIDRLKSGTGSELLLIEKAAGVKIYRDAEHPCPQCKTTLLYRHFFSKQYDTEVNQCSKCSGFWIDAGGLGNIIKLSGEEKNVLLKKYNSAIINQKISGMNLANQDIAEAANSITKIFMFLSPELETFRK